MNVESIQVPNGYGEIVSTFGDIRRYVGSDGMHLPAWEQDQLSFATLAFPIRLSWDQSITVTKIRCHKLLAPTFEFVFQEMVRKDFARFVKTYGGCFNYRPQRSATKLSTHSWGIAIDLNPESNEQGTMGNMNPGIIKLFEAAGFEWGGRWLPSRQDPMHFQYATGY